MVHLPDGLLFEDRLDKRWMAETGERVVEVIFPSRHAAVSGQASCTLHPIGVPHLPAGETGPYGGIGGSAPPPSPRLAGWWKMLLDRAPKHPALEGFDLSLEVTHHGPVLDAPCLFIEVGSTEATEGHAEAAKLLAEIIRDGLLKNEVDTQDPNRHADDLVLVTLGGGHYAPTSHHLASVDRVWLGHMLWQPMPCPLFVKAKRWVVRVEAVDPRSTRLNQNGLPGRNHRLFDGQEGLQGWQRQAIRDLLEVGRNTVVDEKQQIQQRLDTA